jgi:hypothetical protein
MSNFPNDFEDLDLKTAVSTNVYRYVTGTEVKKTQCLCGLLRVLRVRTPKGGAAPPRGRKSEIRNPRAESPERSPKPEIRSGKKT